MSLGSSLRNSGRGEIDPQDITAQVSDEYRQVATATANVENRRWWWRDSEAIDIGFLRPANIPNGFCLILVIELTG